MSLSADTIIASDHYQATVFFFNKKGDYIKSFKRCGQSGEEYNSISMLTVDYLQQELYVYDRFFLSRILVYDFSGNFKRMLKIPKQEWFEHLYVYDDKRLIGYSKMSWNGHFWGTNAFLGETPYYFIDKQTGDMTPVPISIKKRISDEVRFHDEKSGESMLSSLFMDSMTKTKDGCIIADPSLDTVYHYVNDVLEPIAVFKNRDMKENLTDLHTAIFYSDRYLLFETAKMEVDYNQKKLVDHPSHYLFCDRKTQKIYEASFYLSDITKRQRISSHDVSEKPADMYVTIFTIDHLKWLLEQEAVKGKLKKIAEELPEDANSVMMIAKFKE